MLYLPEAIEEPTIIRKEVAEGIYKDIISVEVSGPEYKLCEQYSLPENYQAYEKGGDYGDGLGKEKGDEYKPVRTGLLGEVAFAKIFIRPVDFFYRKLGDDQDFILFELPEDGGVSVDTKCAMRDYGANLIWAMSKKGWVVPIDKDIYVNSYVRHEDRAAKTVTIYLIGYVFRDEVLARKMVPAAKGHMNYRVSHAETRSIIQLMEESRKHDLEYA